MHVEIALRLVERHWRQRAGFDRGDEVVAVGAAADAGIAQVLLPCRRAGRELAEIVERLMMDLEIRHFRKHVVVAVAVAVQRKLPAAGVPGPVDVRLRQQVADGEMGLRRQCAWAVRVGELWLLLVVTERRRICRANGVDRPEIRRERVGCGELRAALHCTGRRVVGQFRTDARGIVALDHSDLEFRRAPVRLRIERWLRRDQVLMVEERTAESAHEEVVAQGVLPRELPQLQVCRAVGIVTHHHRAGVAPGDEAIVPAAIDLQLVLVEAMHQIARNHAVRQRGAVGGAQGERLVRQAADRMLADLVLTAVDRLRVRRQAAPDRRQGGEQAAVAVTLAVFGRVETLQRLRQSREVREQVVEASVLGIQHHHLLDVLAQQRVERGGGRFLRAGWGRATAACRGAAAEGQRRPGDGDAAEQAPAFGVEGGFVGWLVGGFVSHRIGQWRVMFGLPFGGDETSSTGFGGASLKGIIGPNASRARQACVIEMTLNRATWR